MIIRKSVIKIAIPIMIEQAFILFLGICNTIMAGHIGEEAVSAVGMVDTINNMFIAIFSAIAVGATVVIAQEIGQNKSKEVISSTASEALISGIIVSIILVIIMWIFKSSIIESFYGSASEEVKKYSNSYFNFTLISYPFIAAQQTASGILRGSGNTKIPMYVTGFMNVINVILGYLFIYGIDINIFGNYIKFNSLGIEGAALAIGISRFIGAILIIGVLLRGCDKIKINSLLKIKFSLDMEKKIYGIGIPAGIEQFIFNAGKIIVQIFVVTMGTVSITANTIGFSVCTIPNVIGNALALAGTTLVGQSVGRGDFKGAKGILIYLTKFGTVFMFAMGMIMVPISPWLASLYTDNIEVINLSALIIRMCCFALLFWPISFIMSSGLKGAGDTTYTMITAFVGMWIFRILFGYILGVYFKMGIVGMWIGMFVDWLVRGIMYCYRLKGTKWLKHKI
ncbi:MAG: MATE family efflux transporter [Clostridiales bacterium]|nr:MATE family efflux transporter [Clostridiales bacterium]